jgi:hypothetical protein
MEKPERSAITLWMRCFQHGGRMAKTPVIHEHSEAFQPHGPPADFSVAVHPGSAWPQAVVEVKTTEAPTAESADRLVQHTRGLSGAGQVVPCAEEVAGV